jgi:hypothetical protein
VHALSVPYTWVDDDHAVHVERLMQRSQFSDGR